VSNPSAKTRLHAAPSPPAHSARAAVPPVRSAEHAPPVPAAEPATAAATAALRGLGRGSPLAPTTRQRMERAFGQPFGDVRVHSDGAAARVTGQHGAEAMTVGRDIALAPGMYQPGTQAGDYLLAHELTHVVQQRGSAPTAQARSVHSVSSEPAEVQAETAAARVIRGLSAGVTPGSHAASTRTRIMRRARSLASHLPAVASTPVPGAGMSPVQSSLPPALTAQVSPASRRGASQMRAPQAQAARDGSAAPGAATEPAAGERAEKDAQAQPADTKAAAAPAAGSPAVAVATAPAAQPAIKPAPSADAAELRDEQQAAEQARAAGAEATAEPVAAAQSPGKDQKAPASPHEDPAFQRVIGRVGAVAAQQAHNTAAERKAAEAQAAAMAPPNEVASKAAGRQVAKMAQQEPKPFDRAAFKAALLDKIRQIAPQNVEEVESFQKSGKTAAIKSGLDSQVVASKQASQGPIQSATEEAPSPAGIQPKPVTPQPPTEPGPAPADIGAEAAAPKPKSEAEVSLEHSQSEVESKWAEGGLTEERLRNAHEPQCDQALESRQQVQDNVAEAPALYRAEEEGTLAGAQSQAAKSAAEGTGGMYATRGEQFAKIAGDQASTRSDDERKRAEVSEKIQGIYDGTKSKVEARLTQLDTDVNATFDSGAEAARQSFDSSVEAKKNAWRAEHPILSIVEMLGFPVDLQQLYSAARDEYIAQMDGVIDRVAGVVETGLNEAKQLIDDGRSEIETYVAGLPDDLKQIGQDAASQIQSKFDTLESDVRNRESQLVDSLAQKYVEQLAAVDQAIDAMKNKDRGFVGQAIADAEGVLEIYEKIKAMLARFADIVDQILDDPGAFLNNLIAGIKAGLSAFMGNILQHLKKGLMEWLFGALASAGIEIPESFDLKSILKLVMQVMGLTYANIRARAVRLVGEPIVAAMETAVEIFNVLRTEGIAGLWSWIKDMVGDLKSMVLDGIISWVKEKVIVAGITWIMSLLNPAGALIKIASAIIKIVDFFVTRGAQLMALADAVLNSLSAIVGGNIGAMAGAIEGALARAIPVTIGFLAALLGLGGVSDMIRAQLDRAQAPVNKAIDWVIAKAVKLAKQIAGLFGKKKPGEEQPPETNDPEHDAKLAAGLAAIDQEEQRHLKSGRITRKDAQKVASNVRQKHPVFKSITVSDGDGSWDYGYVASPKKRKKGESSAEIQQAQAIYGVLSEAEKMAEAAVKRAAAVPRGQGAPAPSAQGASAPSAQSASAPSAQSASAPSAQSASAPSGEPTTHKAATARRYEDIAADLAKLAPGIDINDYVSGTKSLLVYGEGPSNFASTMLDQAKERGAKADIHAMDIGYYQVKDEIAGRKKPKGQYPYELLPPQVSTIRDNMAKHPGKYIPGAFQSYEHKNKVDTIISPNALSYVLEADVSKEGGLNTALATLRTVLGNLKPGGTLVILTDNGIVPKNMVLLNKVIAELKAAGDISGAHSRVSQGIVLLKSLGASQ
jgi:hypothetical protein